MTGGNTVAVLACNPTKYANLRPLPLVQGSRFSWSHANTKGDEAALITGMIRKINWCFDKFPFFRKGNLL
jgi:hypothetical protein